MPETEDLNPENLDDREPGEESVFASFEESPSKEWLKIALIGIGVLVVIVLIARVGYRFIFKRSSESESPRQSSAIGSLLSPTLSAETPLPTPPEAEETGPLAGWQTLVKRYHNYSLRVPPDWRIEVQRPDLKMASWTFFSPPGIRSYPVEIGTEYIGHNRSRGESLRECIEYWLNKRVFSDLEVKPLSPFLEKSENTTLDGREGIKYYIGFRTSGRKDVWLFVPIENKEKDDYDYTLKIVARDVDDDLLGKFDLMLGSFKFLEEAEVEKLLQEEDQTKEEGKEKEEKKEEKGLL